VSVGKTSIAINGVHYLLTKLGLSWISARSKHPKQDKEAQALYKKLQTKGNRCLTYGHSLNFVRDIVPLIRSFFHFEYD
jgi:hypothetical protein